MIRPAIRTLLTPLLAAVLGIAGCIPEGEGRKLDESTIVVDAGGATIKDLATQGVDLLMNGDFTQDLQHWNVIHASNIPDTWSVDVKNTAKECRWFRLAGADGGHAGVKQDLNVDVSAFARLVLRARVKVMRHDLWGSGWWSDVVGGTGEYPVKLVVKYIGVDDAVHSWTHGFLSHANTERLQNYTVSPLGVWTSFEVDLAAADSLLKPDPLARNPVPRLPAMRVVRQVQLLGNGWSFEGWVDDVSLRGTLAPGDDRIRRGRADDLSAASGNGPGVVGLVNTGSGSATVGCGIPPTSVGNSGNLSPGNGSGLSNPGNPATGIPAVGTGNGNGNANGNGNGNAGGRHGAGNNGRGFGNTGPGNQGNSRPVGNAGGNNGSGSGSVPVPAPPPVTSMPYSGTILVGSNRFVQCGTVISIAGTPLFGFLSRTGGTVSVDLQVKNLATGADQVLVRADSPAVLPTGAFYTNAGGTAELRMNNVVIFRAVVTTYGIQVDLDLRPLRIDLYTDGNGCLHIGSSSLSGNTVRWCGVGVWVSASAVWTG